MYQFLQIILVAALLFLNILDVNATGQSGERIIYKGDTLEMLSVPLEVFLQDKGRGKISPYLEHECPTALWRGYVGLWMIRDGNVNSRNRPQRDLTGDWPDMTTKPVDHPFGRYADTFPEQQHKYGPFKPIQQIRDLAKKHPLYLTDRKRPLPLD